MLFRNKKKIDVNGGKWVGIGGKFKAGETAEECLIREVFEETGLSLTDYHFHGIIEFHSNLWEDENMYLYSASDFTGTLNNSCDEGELKWVPKDDVLSLPMWEGDFQFLKPLIDGEKDINMKLYYEGETLTKIEKL